VRAGDRLRGTSRAGILLLGASVGLAVPVAAVPAEASGVVRLVPSFTLLERDGQDVAYALLVRATGGTARDVTVRLVAERPLVWRERPAGCSPGGNPNRLRCSLGDIKSPRSLPMTLRVPRSARGTLSLLAVLDGKNVGQQVNLATSMPAQASPEVTKTPKATKNPQATKPSQTPKPSQATPSETTPTQSKAASPKTIPSTPEQTGTPKSSGQSSTKPSKPRGSQPEATGAAPALTVPPPVTPGGPAPPGPPGTLSPTLPPLPSPSGPVLPSPQVAPQQLPHGMAMSRSRPAGSEGETWDWPVVFAIVVVTEAALLWLMAFLLVMRSRRALNRLTSR